MMADITTWTTAGLTLLAKWNTGTPQVFDGFWVGSGRGEASPDMVNLINPIAQGTTTVPIQIDNTISYTGQYRNNMHPDLPAFTITEYALFAIDPTAGRVMMYRTELDGTGDEVPMHPTASVTRSYPQKIVINGTADISMTYPAGAFIDSEELEERLRPFLPNTFLTTMEISLADCFAGWDLYKNEGGIQAPLEDWGFTNATLTLIPSRVAVDLNTNSQPRSRRPQHPHFNCLRNGAIWQTKLGNRTVSRKYLHFNGGRCVAYFN